MQFSVLRKSYLTICRNDFSVSIFRYFPWTCFHLVKDSEKKKRERRATCGVRSPAYLKRTNNEQSYLEGEAVEIDLEMKTAQFISPISASRRK